MKRSKLKDRNWQDVTEAECRVNHEWDETDEWYTAAVKNCVAYGDPMGGGLDVRCSFNDETVGAWHIEGDTSIGGIHAYLDARGWKSTEWANGRYVAVKGDTEVIIDYEGDDTSYIRTEYMGDGGKPLSFYEDEEDCELARKRLAEQADSFLSHAEKLLSEEVDIARRIDEGTETFTSTDTEYLGNALDSLRKGMRLKALLSMDTKGLRDAFCKACVEEGGMAELLLAKYFTFERMEELFSDGGFLEAFLTHVRDSE